MLKIISLIILSLLFTSNANSEIRDSDNRHYSRNNIHMHRNQGKINNFYILFIIVKTGSFNCISHYLENSRFKDNIKIRSISIDTLRIKNNQTIEAYEQIIKNKLVNESYNFIVILDEFGLLSSDFYKFAHNEYNNNSVIISYSWNSDIYLSLTFDRFFTFIRELFNTQDINVHYLYNINSPMNDHYSNLLSNNYGVNIKLIKHQILYRKDLTLLLNSLTRQSNTIIISNLDYVIDEVSAKLLLMADLTSDLEYYNKNNIFLAITHNICKNTHTAFTLSWDMSYISAILDNFIADKQQHIDLAKQIIPSRFNVNFTLGSELLKKYDIHKLENLLEYTDNVINDQ